MVSFRGKTTIAIVLACLIGGLVPLGQAATSAADLALGAENAEEAVSGLSNKVSTVPVATPVPGGRIAFVSDRDGNPEIYVMNADGSGQSNLTNNPTNADQDPSWSADGTRIAFASSPPGNKWDIYVMNADGSGVTRVTNSPAYDWWPSWSPDGARIALESDNEICVMNADGSGLMNLTNHPEIDTWPSWSPDGTRIVFASYRDDNYEIYIINADGSGLTRLTINPAWDRYPSWSPDGTRIAFTSYRDGNPEIYVMAIDGSRVIRLTNSPAGDESPCWSPDGTSIAFTSYRDGNADIYIVNADGGGVARLTNNPAEDWKPSWAPADTEPSWQDIAPLMSEKRSLIPTLSSPTFDFMGIPMPSRGYDEGSSSELLTRLEEGQGTGLLSPSEASVLQRLVLTEEALSELYPTYSLAADDTADGTLTLLVIGLGFIRAFQQVDKNLADTPFSPIAKQLLVRITAKIVDLLNTFLTWAERSISDPYWRETIHMMREGLWRAAQLYIMEAQDPFADRGMTFLNAFSDVTLKPVAIEVLLARYVGQTQPIIDRAVHTADPEYTGLDKNEVQPTDERARIQKEGVIDQAEIWSEYHHETYQRFKETADIPGVVGDLADIASMTGILAPIGQVVARVSDVMEGLLVGYGSAKSWQFLQCLESQAFDGEARIYDPSIPGGEYTGPCERAHRLGLFSLRDDGDRGVVLNREAKARVEGELADYGALVESVLEALEGEDEEELVLLIEQLLQEDQALAQEIGMMDVALAATDPEGSTEVYSREVEFQLQSIVFYASLIDALVASGDEVELKDKAIAEGEELLDALATYEVGVEAIPEMVEMEEETGAALVAIGEVRVPGMGVGEEASIEVEVLNLGSGSSGEVSLHLTGGEHVRIAEERVRVGQLDEGQEEVVVFRAEGLREGTEILMVELYEGERYITGEMVLARVSEGRESLAAPGLAFEPWVGLLCGVIGLMPLILGSGIGVWLWSRGRRASRDVQRCAHCGAENVVGGSFCIGCGETLGEG